MDHLAMRCVLALVGLVFTCCADAGDPARIIPVSGPASIPAGATSPVPFVVQVVDSAGAPVPGWGVSFQAYPATFDGRLGAGAFTDANGMVFSPPLSVPMASDGSTTKGVVRAYVVQGSGALLTSNIFYQISSPTTDENAQDLWWGGTTENGWGVSIFQKDRRPNANLFVVLFVYDDSGNPIWYVMPSGEWLRLEPSDYFPDDPYGTEWRGKLYRASGSPFHDYDAGKLVLGPAVGEASLWFIGAHSVDLSYSLYPYAPEHSGVKRLQRLDFSNDAASARTQVADLWWGGPAQNGWGLAVHEKQGALFSIWFTYDENGSPTWFAMPSGEWTDASTYSGRIYQPTGSRWVGVPYDASKFSVTDVGSFRLRFADGTPARQSTFEYSVGPFSGVLQLSRLPFGLDNTEAP